VTLLSNEKIHDPHHRDNLFPSSYLKAASALIMVGSGVSRC
jgi:hypothetical protein